MCENSAELYIDIQLHIFNAVWERNFFLSKSRTFFREYSLRQATQRWQKVKTFKQEELESRIDSRAVSMGYVKRIRKIFLKFHAQSYRKYFLDSPIVPY